jgi:hypothetical protein
MEGWVGVVTIVEGTRKSATSIDKRAQRKNVWDAFLGNLAFAVDAGMSLSLLMLTMGEEVHFSIASHAGRKATSGGRS